MIEIRRLFSPKIGSLFLLLFGGLAVAPVGCTSDGLIGGDCEDGYAFCDGACISVMDDEENCGACNNACSRRLACVDGLCGGEDGNIPLGGMGGGLGLGGDDGSGSGGISVGAGGPGGNDSGGSNGTGSVSGTGNSGNGGGGQCFPPYDRPSACGDCDTECSGSRPNCAPDGNGSYECVAECLDAPFDTLCSGECVDVQTNPRHCGDCGSRCPSGICVSGECIGQTSGHLVALCMNFESQASQPTRLLANAVFLAGREPARILAYVRDTRTRSENGTDFALSQAASIEGKTYSIDKVTGLNSIPDQLTRADFDVLMVYDQALAPSGQMADLGVDWANTIDSFISTGGVVVVLAGGRGTDEMHEFIDEIGFFSSNGTRDHVSERFYVQAPGDAVGINVVSPFVGVQSSCVFDGADPEDREFIYVVSDTDPDDGVGDPGVLHRIVSP